MEKNVLSATVVLSKFLSMLVGQYNTKKLLRLYFAYLILREELKTKLMHD